MDITYNLTEDDLKTIETCIAMQMMVSFMAQKADMAAPDVIHSKVMEVIKGMKET